MNHEWEAALARSMQGGAWEAWRCVDAQHVVSTLRLSGNDPGIQELLERILDESRPTLLDATRGLHYLLAAPFSSPPPRHGSRFRTWPEPGVLYATQARRSACAELGYWRWRFVQDSKGLKEICAVPQTVFQVAAGGTGIPLQTEPLSAWQSLWTHPSDYSATRELARHARGLGVKWISYQSVRDPEKGLCYALLDPLALQPKHPIAQETWFLTVTQSSAVWRKEKQHFVFRY